MYRISNRIHHFNRGILLFTNTKTRCKLQANIFITFYFFLDLIDCVMLLDRISNTSESQLIKSLFEKNPYVVSTLIFFFCNVVMAPSYFFFSQRSTEEYSNVQTDYRLLINFTYCFREPAVTSWLGRFFLIEIVFIRNLLTLLLQIILSVYSIIAFKNYLDRRLRDFRDLNSNNNSNNLNQTFDRVEKFNNDLAKMTISLSAISILSHIFIAIVYLLTVFDTVNSVILRILNFLAAFFTILKYLSNFFLFFFFNHNFRAFLNRCFRFQNDESS